MSKLDRIALPETWELLADLDLLQSNLAGSCAWSDNADGRGIRTGIVHMSRELSRRAASLGLDLVAHRLILIAEALEQYDQASG